MSFHSRRTADDSPPPPLPDRPVDVPAGPVTGPRLDPGAARLDAEHAGLQDAASYDKHTMTVDQRLLFEFEVDAAIRQFTNRSTVERIRQETLADQLHADKVGEQARAEYLESTGSAAQEAAKQAVESERAVLTGDGPFADPTRLHESGRISWLRQFVPPICVGAAELGLNYLVFQAFDGTQLETLALAATVGAFGVLGGHMAGAQARRFRGAHGWRELAVRWVLPVGAAVLLACVGLMLAILRGGFIDAPQVNPTTGAAEPSLLAGMHVGLSIIVAGWFALQAGLSLFVAWHAERTHNPHVGAHRIAVKRLARRDAELAELKQKTAKLTLIVDSAVTDKTRVPSQFQAERDTLGALGGQLLVIYIRAMCRVKNDPAFTAVAEQRLNHELITHAVRMPAEPAVPGQEPDGAEPVASHGSKSDDTGSHEVAA